MKEIEGKKELLLIEQNKIASERAEETETGDALDAFMSGLSSQLGETPTIKVPILCLIKS